MKLYAITWDSHANRESVSDEAVLSILNTQLGEFIKAYTTANSKLKSQRQSQAIIPRSYPIVPVSASKDRQADDAARLWQRHTGFALSWETKAVVP